MSCDSCACSAEPVVVPFHATGETVLEEAARIVDGDRRTDYGHPAENHGCTAEFWTTYLRRRGYLRDGAALDGYDVCWLNSLQKTSRDAHRRKRDNLVDSVGFVRNAEIIAEP